MRNEKEIKELTKEKSEQTAVNSESCCDSTCCCASGNKEKSMQSNSETIQPVNKRGK